MVKRTVEISADRVSPGGFGDGITFARTAMNSSDEEISATATRNARRAYDIVLRFLSRVSLKQLEEKELRERLASLKSDLQNLGETF